MLNVVRCLRGVCCARVETKGHRGNRGFIFAEWHEESLLGKDQGEVSLLHPREDKVHAFRFRYFYGEEKRVIEVGGSHNNLECLDTGMIFDQTLGQLSGSMKPAIFSTEDSFRKEFVGEVMHYMDSPGNDIQEQKQRDIHIAAMNKKPTSHPKRIAKRVVDLFLCGECEEESRYCANCLGIAAVGSKLLRCTRCKRISYCSKHCRFLTGNLISWYVLEVEELSRFRGLG